MVFKQLTPHSKVFVIKYLKQLGSKAGKGLEGCLQATGIHQQSLVFMPTVSNRFCQQVTCHTSSIW